MKMVKVIVNLKKEPTPNVVMIVIYQNCMLGKIQISYGKRPINLDAY